MSRKKLGSGLQCCGVKILEDPGAMWKACPRALERQLEVHTSGFCPAGNLRPTVRTPSFRVGQAFTAGGEGGREKILGSMPSFVESHAEVTSGTFSCREVEPGTDKGESERKTRDFCPTKTQSTNLMFMINIIEIRVH